MRNILPRKKAYIWRELFFASKVFKKKKNDALTNIGFIYERSERKKNSS